MSFTLFAFEAKCFRTALLHYQKATVQVLGKYLGSRVIAEMNEIKVTDFVEINALWMEYNPSGVTKTTKVNSQY
jgi:hypothetical protein